MHLSVFLAPLLCLSLDGRVVLRERVPTQVQGVVEVSAAGVTVVEGAGKRIIGWQRVTAVEGPQAGIAQVYLQSGEDLWRALARLERGDFPSAETLLERFKGEITTTPGPTAEAIWMGLVRCRLDRGAQTAAAAAWISWCRVHLVDNGQGSTAEQGVSSDSAVDSTGLLPAVPPIWLNIPSVAVIAAGSGDPWKADPAGAPGFEALKAWYVRAARGACELPQGEWPSENTDRRGQLVAAVVRAQYGDSKERLAAREALKLIMAQHKEPWIESWARVAIGRSLLKESDPETRRLGVVELLHVPARLETVVPYLTGIALADAASALREMGDLQGATSLRDELFRKYSGHPATEWAPVRDWPAVAPRKSQDPEAKDLPES